MDNWRCDECNMKFDSRILYDTHKRKFCGLLGEPPGPGSTLSTPRGYDKTDVHLDRRGKFTSPRELVYLALPGEKSPLRYQHRTTILSPRSPLQDASQRMSALEQEKVEELKAFKASMSLQRASQHSKIKPGSSSRIPDSRQSRSSPNYMYQDTTVFDEQIKLLHENHQEQLHQLRAHNERLKEEKMAIQEKMNSLGLRSRQNMVSQGSVHKQTAELEGLQKYLAYASKRMSNDYKTEMDKLKDLKKKINGRSSLSPETTLSTKRSSPVEELKDNVKRYDSADQDDPLNAQYSNPVSLPQYAAQQGGGLVGEINAMEESYLQGGGRDPEILSQIKELELEAKRLQPVSTAVPDPSLQQQITAYHLANQKLEQELQLLRMERHQNDGLRKTSELSPEFQRLKAEHLEKMAGLKQESGMLKQLTEIERMKKELNELRGDKVVMTDDRDKQKYETPFLMSISGLEKSLLPSPYDPSAGFSVFMDFVLGMPPSFTKCRLAVGIYNGTELASDVKVLPLVNVANKHNSKIPPGGVAVFGIMHPFPKCAPIQTLSVVAELQANNIDDPQDPNKLFSKGWTKMDLFDTADRLMSGRWKIPFRVPPIKTYLSYNELNRIPQVEMTELYMRLANARDVRQEELLSPQPLQYYFYKYPSLDYPMGHHFSRQRITRTAPSTAESAVEEPPLPPPSAPYRQNMRGGASLTSLKSNQNDPDASSILGFQVDQLYDAIDGELKIKITGYNQQDGEILKAAGNTPVMCVTKSLKQEFLKDIYVFGLQEVLFRQVDWNSKSIVIIRVYLQPKEPGTDKIPAVNLLDESRLAAWTLIPLAYNSGRVSRQSEQGLERTSSLNVGIHTVPLFFPPVPEITDIPFKIDKYPSEWSRYGRATLRMAIFPGLHRPLDRPSTPPEFVEENEVPKNAWIKNGRSSVTTQQFAPGCGFDLYIDGARFLPDSVTFTKVAGRVMDKNYDKVGPDIDCQSKLYADVFNPEFDHRLEFREPDFPATSTLMLKVYTVDRISKKLSCLGYAFLPVFLRLGSTDPPLNNNDTEFSLNEGAHQIRIFNGSPDVSQPLSQSLIQKLKPVPCASLLVRIVLAACHPNGRPKKISEFPESQWEGEGLMVAKKPYEEGQYFSLSCEPTLGECQIFHSMMLRQPLTVRESVKLIGNNQEKNLKKDRIIASWIKTQLTRSIDTAPEDFNLNYVALYHQLHGLKVSVDGAQNLPWEGLTFATYCLSPPGSFYKGDQSDPLHFSSQLNYSSDVSSPVWIDDVKTFPRRLYHQFLVLVVHLHEVTVDFSQHQEVYGLKGQAWTVLQVFHEGYVLNGCYQLPLYIGEPSESVLDALQNDYSHDVLAAFRRSKKIKYLEGASVFLRLSDSRREDELPKPMTHVLQDYVPKERLERYTTPNPSKPLSSILPPGIDENEFFQSLPEKFEEMIKHIFAKRVSEPNQK